MVKAAQVKRQRGRIPIGELLDYWIDISKRQNLTVKDFEVFLKRVAATMEYFEESYGNRSPMPDKFLKQMHYMLHLFRDGLLKAVTEAATERGLSDRDYVYTKDVAKKFIRRIKERFSRDIVAAINTKTPLQDAEAILGQSNKLTYRWAAGIVVSNHIASLLIQLCRFRTGEKYKDDIRTLADNLKNRATNRKLKTFLTRSHRRIEDADKLRNRCAHVIDGEPTKQEIQQSIAFARLLQKYIPAVSTRRRNAPPRLLEKQGY
jgi:hypothetical protein